MKDEIQWRVDVMRTQWSGSGIVPFLMARPDVNPSRPGACPSCGDVLDGPDSAAGIERCAACAQAARIVVWGSPA